MRPRHYWIFLLTLFVTATTAAPGAAQGLLDRLRERMESRFPAPVPPPGLRPLGEDTARPPENAETGFSLGVQVFESGFQPPYRVVIRGVTPGSVADAAGLRTGDVIMAMDGRPVARIEEITALVQSKRPGEQMRIDYARGLRRMDTVATFPREAVRQRQPPEGEGSVPNSFTVPGAEGMSPDPNGLGPGAPTLRNPPPPPSPDSSGPLQQPDAIESIPRGNPSAAPATPLPADTSKPGSDPPSLRSPGNEPAEGQQPNIVVERTEPGSGRLGITVENASTSRLNPEVPVRRGAVVVGIQPGLPADQLEMAEGDVVVAIDGALIRDAAALIEEVSKTRPGQEIEITYYQGQTLKRARVTLAGDASGRGSENIAGNTQKPTSNSNGGKSSGILGSVGSALGGLFSGTPGDDPPASPQRSERELDAIPRELPSSWDPLPSGDQPADPNRPRETSPASSASPRAPGSSELPPTADALRQAAQQGGAQQAVLRAEINRLRDQMQAIQDQINRLEQQLDQPAVPDDPAEVAPAGSPSP